VKPDQSGTLAYDSDEELIAEDDKIYKVLKISLSEMSGLLIMQVVAKRHQDMHKLNVKQCAQNKKK
jgi:hypothetical protein